MFLSFIFVYLGHIFPIWLKFKGGKGVATFIGGLLIINFKICILFLFTWVIIAKLFKISLFVCFNIIPDNLYLFYNI